MQGTSGSRSNMSCQIAISNKRTGLPARRAKGAYRSLESVPGEYRIIQPVGWRVHSPSGAPADFAGLPGSSARGQVKGNQNRNAVQVPKNKTCIFTGRSSDSVSSLRPLLDPAINGHGPGSASQQRSCRRLALRSLFSCPPRSIEQAPVNTRIFYCQYKYNI